MLRYVALVCARGGSKGVPGKNIRLLGGRSLIGWSIHLASQVERISRIIVSTDSEEIAEVARKEGGEVPFMRPQELANDNSPEWEVWRHALNFLSQNDPQEVDALIVIPPTAPLRSLEDLNNCLDEFEKGDADVIITVSEAHRSPYFNMVKNDADGMATLVIPPDKEVFRRQDAPVVYDMTTVAYVVKPEFILNKNGLFEGNVRSVQIPIERALDIDTELDIKMADFLFQKKNKENGCR